MSRRSKVLHIAAALGVAVVLTQCAGSSEPEGSAENIPPATISIRLEDDRCVVEPARAVIDYEEQRGAPLSVAWNVSKSAFEVALIMPDPQEAMPNLFDVLPTIGRFESSDDSERPIREPIWEDGQYVYHYVVEVEGHKCAGEICVRREGQGCVADA